MDAHKHSESGTGVNGLVTRLASICTDAQPFNSAREFYKGAKLGLTKSQISQEVPWLTH